MSVDAKEERLSQDEPADPPRRPSPIERIRTGLPFIQWPITLFTALGMALIWCALFLSRPELQLLAGLVPVTAGLILGRRVKTQHLLHGAILGIGGFLMGLGLISLYAALSSAGIVPLTAQAEGLITQWPGSNGSPLILVTAFISFSIFALVPFPIFGAVMAGRSEERNRAVQELQAQRGGTLEKPGNTIRSAEDLGGLPLPQLGFYVNTLFKKQGFTFKDYRFVDKDRHLDLWMEREGETWWLRLSTADKVKPGTVESLAQEMRKDNVLKGVVITNTEFTPDAQKAGRNRRSIVLIDGPTLYQMSQG